MPEAGWYEDPQDSAQLRWWDGSAWTDRRQPRDQAPPPPPAGSSVAPAAPPAPASPSWEPSSGAGAGASGGAGAGGSTTLGDAPAWPAPPRSFVEAITVCLRKFVDGKGRASRSEYWYFGLFTLIVDVLTGGVAAIVLLLPSITVSVRRLHDVGRSAWALLWFLVPIVGWGLLLYYAVKPGDPGPNAFG